MASAAAELIRRAVTTYPVMAEPPVLVGGVQWAIAVSSPPTAPWVGRADDGGPGAVAPAVGVTVLDDAENAPVPTLLVAATWKW